MFSCEEKEFLQRKLFAIRDKIEFDNDDSVLGLQFELPSPKEIYDYLDDYIVGQDKAKRILSVAAHNHYKRIMIFKESDYQNKLDKTNLMLIGPTGSGKTYMVKKLAEYLKVPCYIADANSLTAAGYIGKDVESIIENLIDRCQGNYDAAATGIIFIDEFDKIAKRDPSGSRQRDVGGESVQQALLKIIEGTTVEIEKTTGLAKLKLQIDTSNIMVIVGGAFVGLEEIIQKRIGTGENSKIGFGASIGEVEEPSPDLFHQVNVKDFEKFGFIPEILGRIPLTAVVNELSEDDLVHILTKVKGNQVGQYQDLFRYSEKELTFDDNAIKEIASIAKQQKTGARGLKTIIENALLDAMFDVEDTRVTLQDVEKVKESLLKNSNTTG